MTSTAIKETEFVTRTIARWGSVVAAVIFGVAFVTDKSLHWDIVSDQYIYTALVLGIFVGYAFALTERFEVLGSVVALSAIAAIYLYGSSMVSKGPAPIFLAVGAPALFHLVAVVLHRYVLPRSKM